ncbi:MAG: WxcM-like domain-containing protein [Candidatus Diapherotrites archaeon]
MSEEIEIIPLEKKEDERGWLMEILKKGQLSKKEFGQFFVTTAKPGKVKGNHYHLGHDEFFCVIKGKGKLVMKHIETGETKKLEIGEGNMITVKITPKWSHGIKNIGKDEMFLLAYSDAEFDEKKPDTFREVVIE